VILTIYLAVIISAKCFKFTLLKLIYPKAVKKILLSFLFLAGLIVGCKKDDSVNPQSLKDNDAFTLYEQSFLDGLWKLNPDWATQEGYHKYDSLLLAPSNKNRDKQLDFAKLQLDSLSRYDVTTLSEENQIDYHLIQNQMQYTQWQIQQLKQYEWDPGQYNVIGTFAVILNEHYAPLAKRLRSFYQKMAFIPDYYKEAEKQIRNPVVELTQLSIDQHLGGVSVIEKDFGDSLKKSSIPEAEQKLMLDRAQASATVIKAYADWLKNLKNDHPRSFRLGKEFYDDKFKYEIQSQYTSQQIFNAAMDRKKYVHKAMAKISRDLWPKYFGTKPMPSDSLQLISQMLDTISSQHTTVANFQSTIENEIPKLTAFVTEKGLVTLDPTKPLVVRKEPAYMAGVAGASMSSPGPYDKDGNSYYNVGSLANYTPEKAESYLREYNNYTLQILSIHEAIPGHYVQLIYSNQSPSLIKSIFGNNAMIEGWAVYSEQMMIDAGFGGDAPEMKLMWYKWHLRSVCNMILDYSVHAGGMTKEQAINMLTREAFQQPAEAENKWTRVTETSVQLDCYYTGYKEIMDLRAAYKKDQGDNYNLKDFNEKFLSYGSAPVKYIKEAMMRKDAPKKDADK
jgi:uncharacterized protein (DUF885 family)